MNSVATINNTLASSLPAINTKVDSILAELTDAKARVTELEEDLKNAFSEIFSLKDQMNALNQEKRHLSVRIFGLPTTQDEENGPDPNKSTAKWAYDRMIKPLLVAAKEKALISAIPKSHTDIVKEAFRIKSKTPSPG